MQSTGSRNRPAATRIHFATLDPWRSTCCLPKTSQTAVGSSQTSTSYIYQLSKPLRYRRKWTDYPNSSTTSPDGKSESSPEFRRISHSTFDFEKFLLPSTNSRPIWRIHLPNSGPQRHCVYSLSSLFDEYFHRSSTKRIHAIRRSLLRRSTKHPPKPS